MLYYPNKYQTSKQSYTISNMVKNMKTSRIHVIRITSSPSGALPGSSEFAELTTCHYRANPTRRRHWGYSSAAPRLQWWWVSPKTLGDVDLKLPFLVIVMVNNGETWLNHKDAFIKIYIYRFGMIYIMGFCGIKYDLMGVLCNGMLPSSILT